MSKPCLHKTVRNIFDAYNATTDPEIEHISLPAEELHALACSHGLLVTELERVSQILKDNEAQSSTMRARINKITTEAGA